MTQAVGHRHLNAKARGRSPASPCEICVTHWDGFFSRVIRFAPVSIIPPTLYTHSFIYHQRCIMLFSQYFNFLCRYHSNSAPYSPLYCNYSYQKDKRAMPGNLAKAMLFRKSGSTILQNTSILLCLLTD